MPRLGSDALSPSGVGSRSPHLCGLLGLPQALGAPSHTVPVFFSSLCNVQYSSLLTCLSLVLAKGTQASFGLFLVLSLHYQNHPSRIEAAHKLSVR